jgi:ubiquitin-conjugating enzyme E2 A
VKNASIAIHRLKKDFIHLQEMNLEGVSVCPNENNILVWDAVIFRQIETPFEDGVFNLQLEFPEEYPFKPPKIRFTSRIFHPNVGSNGEIEISQSKWSPAHDVLTVFLSIIQLLREPNYLDYSANIAAEKLFKENYIEYRRLARECVRESLHEHTNI